MATEKPNKLREMKDTIFGTIGILGQVKALGFQESYEKVMGTAKVAKEIIETLKTPEMVKNIENFRLISENVSDATEKIQDALQHMQETGIIDEARDLVKSAKGTMSMVANMGQDLAEVSVAFKEIFRSIRMTQDTLHNVSGKYRRPDLTSKITIMPCEVEQYLDLGWQYLGTLPNGKVVVEHRQGLDSQ